MNPFLKKLTELDGVSGNEQNVRRALIAELEGKIEYTVDRIGNLYAHSTGYFPNDIKLMLTAHMDEVGFMITHITKDGYLKFQTVGGIDDRILPGKAVLVGTKKICGVIGSLAIHLQSKTQREQITEVKDLCIDIGAKSREQAEKYVSVGDLAVFSAPSDDLGELLRGKALDDRAGCSILVDLLKDLPEANFTAVFTTREEVGCYGAMAATQAVKPKYAIVLEGTTASDVGETDEVDQVCAVGKGPVLSFMDNGAIYDRKLLDLACKVARREGIPYQIKQAVAGGNEAGRIQKIGNGCYVLAISLPCRYIHGPVSVASEKDMEAMKKLAAAIIRELK
ncbi:MAG: M20/M25/M40 family metallo-hydrolase [Clostridia bacterium]|nr:M20/M25/M40 family metallo-hydrolase [Clostridia bacterium]